MLENIKNLSAKEKKELLFYVVIGIAVIILGVKNLLGSMAWYTTLVSIFMIVVGIIVIGIGLIGTVK